MGIQLDIAAALQLHRRRAVLPLNIPPQCSCCQQPLHVQFGRVWITRAQRAASSAQTTTPQPWALTVARHIGDAPASPRVQPSAVDVDSGDKTPISNSTSQDNPVATRARDIYSPSISPTPLVDDAAAMEPVSMDTSKDRYSAGGLVFKSISALPEHRNFSFEEYRLQARKRRRQVKPMDCDSPAFIAAARTGHTNSTLPNGTPINLKEGQSVDGYYREIDEDKLPSVRWVLYKSITAVVCFRSRSFEELRFFHYQRGRLDSPSTTAVLPFASNFLPKQYEEWDPNCPMRLLLYESEVAKVELLFWSPEELRVIYHKNENGPAPSASGVAFPRWTEFIGIRTRVPEEQEIDCPKPAMIVHTSSSPIDQKSLPPPPPSTATVAGSDGPKPRYGWKYATGMSFADAKRARKAVKRKKYKERQRQKDLQRHEAQRSY